MKIERIYWSIAGVALFAIGLLGLATWWNWSAMPMMYGAETMPMMHSGAMPMMSGGRFGMPMWGGMGWFMLLFWALLIGLIVMGVIVFIRRNDAQLGVTQSSESALDILKTRFAKGEITQEQFDTMRKVLQTST